MTKFIPSVSVVIPVYNGAETISACLESLLNQNYPAEAYDIIVVENGSVDNTTQVVEKYPVRLFHNEIRGPAPARNLGMTKSQADIVAYTDADCIADPNWLYELVQPYSDPGIGGVGGAILAYEHANRNDIERFSDEYSPLINFVSGEDEFLPHLYTANASYRRDLLNCINGFNAKLVTADDVDISWRLQLETGTKLAYAPQAVIYHHHRTTRGGLARQYRQYGFGEILIDTMYGHYPGYPRNRSYQLRRLREQIAAVVRYSLSVVVRRARLLAGWISPYQATVPSLKILIEGNSIRGKIEGLLATRFMTNAQPVLDTKADVLITRLFPSRKE